MKKSMASSYLNLAKDVDAKTAASFAGMFCISITVGRGINGFVGTCLMPSLFGLIANHISIRLLPLYLLILLALMVYMHEILEKRHKNSVRLL